ncbi:MAG: TetR/AcrR family transcriptional regulator [Armatimonadetes bacterium]|nr:TetR/AcrR family transcriptional regulator [Armatimonadota bacterium]
MAQNTDNTVATAVETNNNERREQILVTSWEVLSQVGFEKITTRRIAEAAGINIATLHYYFGSKEAVLTETLRHAQNWADERMREAVAGSQTAEEALTKAFAHTIKMVLTGPGPLRFDMAVRAFRDAEARAEALRVYARYEGFVCEIIEWHVRTGGSLANGFTPQTLAAFVVAMVDGVVLHYLLSGDGVVAERGLNQVKSHVWFLMKLNAPDGVGNGS